MKNFYLALFLLLSSIAYSQNACPGLDSLNYGGQWYHTVQIGYQCWLKENLNVGIIKPAVKDQINNDTIEKFCYNNDPSMCDVYGGLYQWKEAMQYSLKIKNRGICPIGWHVPSMPEYGTLSLSVGGDGNALKQVGQGQGTNTSGFSLLLAGDNQLTSFYDLANSANLWSSESFLAGAFAYLRGYHKTIGYDSSIYSYEDNAIFGLSVRCLQDTDGLFLQAPFGVESWLVGSTHEISWGGSLIDKKIQIDYTTDNGISWINIIGSFPAA